MDPLRIFMAPLLGQLITRVLSFPLQKAWLRIAEPDVKARRSYVDTARELHRQGALYCLASGVQATRRPDPFAAARLACPSALLWGGADRSHTRTAADNFAAYLTEPKVLVAQEAGHFPELSRPELLIAAIAHVRG
jgi:pimeloyl-ACP methyl ester carboxylesterase